MSDKIIVLSGNRITRCFRITDVTVFERNDVTMREFIDGKSETMQKFEAEIISGKYDYLCISLGNYEVISAMIESIVTGKMITITSIIEKYIKKIDSFRTYLKKIFVFTFSFYYTITPSIEYQIKLALAHHKNYINLIKKVNNIYFKKFMKLHDSLLLKYVKTYNFTPIIFNKLTKKTGRNIAFYDILEGLLKLKYFKFEIIISKKEDIRRNSTYWKLFEYQDNFINDTKLHYDFREVIKALKYYKSLRNGQSPNVKNIYVSKKTNIYTTDLKDDNLHELTSIKILKPNSLNPSNTPDSKNELIIGTEFPFLSLLNILSPLDQLNGYIFKGDIITKKFTEYITADRSHGDIIYICDPAAFVKNTKYPNQLCYTADGPVKIRKTYIVYDVIQMLVITNCLKLVELIKPN